MSDAPITNKTSFFDRIAGHALAGIIFLTPIFFLPIFGVSVPSVKFFLLFVLTVVAFVAYLLARSRDGVFVLPRRRATLLTLAVPVTFLMSALVTGKFRDSFFGFGFEPTTVLFMIVMAVLTLVMSVYARNDKALSQVVRVAGISFAIVSGYQLIRLLATLVYSDSSSSVLSFGNFVGTYSNLLGKWNDLAIMSALVMIATIIYWRTLGKRGKYIAGALFVVSGFLMKVIAFSVIWPLLAVFLMIYALKDSVVEGKITLFKGDKTNKFGMAIFGLATLMIMYAAVQSFSATLNSRGQIMHPRIYKVAYFAPNIFGGVPTEYRPGIVSAYLVYKDTIKHSPVFGVGPNRFVESWMLYRPVAINQSPSADSDFAYSFNYIITLMTTVGLLGSLVLVLFILYAFRQTIVLALSKSSSSAEKLIAYSTAFLIVTSLLYVPAPVLITYMFMGIGVIFAKTGKTTISCMKGKVLIKVLAGLVILGSLYASYFLVQQYRANRYFAFATKSVNTDKNISSAETYLSKAIALYPSDTYYRSMSELDVLKANVIAGQSTKDGQISEEGRSAAIESYTAAESYAEKAITANPKNYTNYLFAAHIYEGDPNKLDTAEDMYNKALIYTPNNPNVYLGLAKIKAQKKGLDGVKENIKKALAIRPTFTDALIAAAQITSGEKDIQGTIALLVRAYQSDQSRSDLLLTIAQIQYGQQNDIRAATETLKYAVGTNPTYGDGRVALASLYAKQSNFIDATNLLVGIKTDDQATQDTLNKYITDLKAGKDPFGATAPTTKSTTTPTTTAKVKTVKK